MEGQFPKNVKQVGNVSDSPKIYVEDYVDTYFNQLKEQGRESLVGVFLIGKNTVIEDQECIYVTGAVQMKDLDPESKELDIGKEHLEIARTESKEYFHGQDIIGWLLIMPGHPVGLSGSMIRVHEMLFPEKNSLFMLIDAEDEEQIFTYKFHELMQMGGHYIFYEKNPDMQSYMISERKQIGVTPSEVVEDRAAKDFRSTVRGQLEAREQRRESRYVYLTSVLLVIVVLAIGISTMNNYDKMNSVQTSIETLSSAMQQSSSEGNGQAEESAEIQEMEKNSLENADMHTEQSGNIGQQMEPVVSTVQEDLGESEDYYVVQKGDTLDIISEKVYGTISKTDAIRQKNGLEDGNLIFIGQKLLLP